MGLWGCLKGSKTDFLADKLAEFDQNDDGLLNFEEFKAMSGLELNLPKTIVVPLWEGGVMN